MTSTAPREEADSSRAAGSTRPRVSAGEFWRAARTRRMLAILVLLVAAAIVCGRLGAWQIDRAFQRAEVAAATAAQVQQATAPTPLAQMVDPGEHVTGTMVGLPVTVTGTYEGEQLVVPDRVVDGEDAYLVVAPLRTTEGAWLMVVRGWQTTDQQPPALPQGEVELTGAVTAAESYQVADLPAGQIPSLSAAYLAGEWGLPIYNAYLVLAESDDAALRTVPGPELDGGGEVDLRNLAYAVEWYVFGAFALVVWYRLVREEALQRREEADADAER
ncbi:SURF1 family protein [Serinibacter salmoneus]|uniref:SURF1-like protein n=1 Tax=Serinibacter salmoneus TaxID=556530 RepID=A0A2A9CZH4_9MICO|nr:SURF1 family protein [Serinibacter salmoneus]PFG19000.1 cytochrome oxidase assembly protein ShyY1 [Serinibacter salmoneus]